MKLVKVISGNEGAGEIPGRSLSILGTHLWQNTQVPNLEDPSLPAVASVREQRNILQIPLRSYRFQTDISKSRAWED